MATLTERLLLVVDADSKGAARGLDDVGDSAKRASKDVDNLGKSSKGLGDSLKAGIALGAGALIGGGLASAVLDVGKAYIDAAKGVELFANATNSTVKESSRFMGMADAMGLNVNDLLEIVAEFVPKAEAMADELAEVGIELQKNADGSVNVGRSLEDALEGLQQIPDDAQRMQMAMKLFGEEGSKQLAAIYNGAKPVSEIMDELDFGIDEEDIAKAKQFNESMAELRTSGRDLGFSLAAAVLPAVTTLTSALGPLADVISRIPPELLLVGGGLLAFNRYAGGATAAIAGITGALGGFGADVRRQQDFARRFGTELGTLSTTARTAGQRLRGIGSSISNAFGGPAGVAIIGLTTAYTLLSAAEEDFTNQLRTEGLPRLKELEDSGMSSAKALQQTGEEIYNASGFFERASQASKGYKGLGFLNVNTYIDAALGIGKGADKATEALEKLREEQGLLAVQTAMTADAQKELSDLIAEGVPPTDPDYVAAVEKLAASKLEEKRVTEEADAALSRAMGTYDEAKGAADALATTQQYLQNAFYLGYADADQFGRSIAEVGLQNRQAETSQNAYTAAIERASRQMSEWIGLQRDASGIQRDMADATDNLTTSIETYEETEDDATTRVDEKAQAYRGMAEAASAMGDTAVGAAQHVAEQYGPGSALDAAIADQIAQLETAKNAPGISPEAQAELQTAIDQLNALGQEAVTVSENPATLTVQTAGIPDAMAAITALLGPEAAEAAAESWGWNTTVGVNTVGVPEALDQILTLLGPNAPGAGVAAPTPEGRAWQASLLLQIYGSGEASGEIEDVAAPGGDDRTAPIQVESRGGPAANTYIDGIASKDRLAIIRVESRNGPAVISYLDTIDDERLAIIRVESRNGPAVISYLDSIAGERLAIIRVETRNGPAVDQYLDSLATNNGFGRTATISTATAARSATGVVPTAAGLTATNAAAPTAIAPLGASAQRVTVQNTYRITNEIAMGANPVEVGRATVNAIRQFEAAAGAGWRGT